MWSTVAESGHNNLALSIRKLGEFSVNIITTTQTMIAPESEWSTFHDRGDEIVEELQQNWPNDIIYKGWREDEGSRKGEKAHGRDAAGWIQGFCVGAVSQCVCVCVSVLERDWFSALLQHPNCDCLVCIQLFHADLFCLNRSERLGKHQTEIRLGEKQETKEEKTDKEILTLGAGGPWSSK